MNILVATFLLNALAGGLDEQSKPSFAGTWVLTRPPEVVAANLGGVTGGGKEMSITQDQTTIRIDRTFARGQASFVIKLDGSESTNVAPLANRFGEKPVLSSKARWDGSKLVIFTTRTIPAAEPGGTVTKVEIKEVLSLEGGTLIVERTTPIDGGAMRTSTDTYKRIDR